VNRLITDALLLNEIPSPTEQEVSRAEFIVQRLVEFGYADAGIDPVGNVVATVPAASATGEYVLLFADLRCDDYSPLESIARLESGRMLGRGIAETATAAALLVVLAEYIAARELQFDRNVVLLFTFHAEDGSAPALEDFLRRWNDRIVFAACLRGLGQGGLEVHPLGVCRLSVKTRRESGGEERGGKLLNAISVLSAIATRLDGVHWDTENATYLNIARLEAGTGFGSFASDGILDLEVFSPNAASLEMARELVLATIHGTAEQMKADVEVRVASTVPPGNPEMTAPLVEIVRAVHDKLRIPSHPVSLPTYAAVPVSMGIPAITLGLCRGTTGTEEEYVELPSLESGIRLALGFIEACALVSRQETP
jgi:acetylornithine deacetylase/succinyl-diaminopimelate desuccinylase-like protein